MCPRRGHFLFSLSSLLLHTVAVIMAAKGNLPQSKAADRPHPPKQTKRQLLPKRRLFGNSQFKSLPMNILHIHNLSPSSSSSPPTTSIFQRDSHKQTESVP